MCVLAGLLFVALTASARADVFDDNPSAAALNGTVHVFARDAANHILERRLANGVWTEWSAVPGDFEAGSGPSALTYGSSLMLFARGQDGAVWWNTFSNNAWFGWASLGGGVTS